MAAPLTHRQYFDFLMAPLKAGGLPLARKDLLGGGITLRHLKSWKDENPTRLPRWANDTWCAIFPTKAAKLCQYYRAIWGWVDPVEEVECSSVFSPATVEMMRADCVSAADDPALSPLDHRFALENLGTLAEIAKNWPEAEHFIGEMLKLQKRIGDHIYTARARIRAAYICYKHARIKHPGIELLKVAEDHLHAARRDWEAVGCELSDPEAIDIPSCRESDRGLAGKRDVPAHPDIKTLIKYYEIRALIFSRTKRAGHAVAYIDHAQRLRRFSGKAGQATGFHRAGVIYAEAAKINEAFVQPCRKAFESAVSLRKELHLWRDAGFSALAWATAERTAVERFTIPTRYWLIALEQAFNCFRHHDIPTALDVALTLFESDRSEFIDFGARVFPLALRQVNDQLIKQFSAEEVMNYCNRRGWKIWVQSHPHARRQLAALLRSLRAFRRDESKKGERTDGFEVLAALARSAG